MCKTQKLDQLKQKEFDVWMAINRLKDSGQKGSPEHLALRIQLYEIVAERKELESKVTGIKRERVDVTAPPIEEAAV